MALESGKPEAAQIVAAECVVEAETKDQAGWENGAFALLGAPQRPGTAILSG